MVRVKLAVPTFLKGMVSKESLWNVAPIYICTCEMISCISSKVKKSKVKNNKYILWLFFYLWYLYF